jgi:hypothetical protein
LEKISQSTGSLCCGLKRCYPLDQTLKEEKIVCSTIETEFVFSSPVNSSIFLGRVVSFDGELYPEAGVLAGGGIC